jgi:hypothetical protein
MMERLLGHLDRIGDVKTAVNYLDPASFPLGSDLRQKHSFPLTPFENAIYQGNYAVAEALSPYVDDHRSRPTTLYQLLKSPGKDILKHIRFLLQLDLKHRRYICDPLTGQNVLHIAIVNHGKFVGNLRRCASG